MKITVITGATNHDPFIKYVVPMLKVNKVEYEFQGLEANMPIDGVCLFMGGLAIDSIRDLELPRKILNPKNASIAKARQKIWYHTYEEGTPSVPCFFTYDPNIISMDPGREPDILWDIQKVCRFVSTGSIDPDIGKYGWVSGFTFYNEIAKKANQAKESGTALEVSTDLETMGLIPFIKDMRILTVSVTFEKGTAMVYKIPEDGMPDKDALPALKLLSNPSYFKLIGANLKFDILWMMEKWGISFENQSFDTTIVGCLLNENISNSLNVHAKLHTMLGGYDDDFNLKWDKAHMEVPLDKAPDEFITYAGGDTDACFRVYPTFKTKLLDDKALANFYLKVLKPASKVFVKMEHRGVCVDADAYAYVKSEVTKDMEAYRTQLLDMLPRRIKLKHRESNGKTKLKAAVISDFLFSPMGLNLDPQMVTEKTKSPSTAKEHMAMFIDHEVAGPFANLLRDFRQAEKTIQTYVTGFKAHLRSDGKFHPTYNLARADYGHGKDEGTVTGRTSSSDPAYQCQPGWSRILTRTGYRSMQSIIHGLNVGEEIEVLSHDGTWRRVSNPHDNGMQELYRVRTSTGKVLECTGNHPVLTNGGWVEVQSLNTRHKVVVHNGTVPKPDRSTVRAANSLEEVRPPISSYMGMSMSVRDNYPSEGWQSQIRQHNYMRLLSHSANPPCDSWAYQGAENQNVSFMGRHEGSMLHAEPNLIHVLRGSWNQGVRAMANLHEFLGGYGRNARGSLNREVRREQALRAEHLHMDSEESAELEQAQFSEEQVREVVKLHGETQTWGISVEETHSYVSEGIVNHNTIPKHTKYAKILRTVFVPPPGYVGVCIDFSQGELRIYASLAGEIRMINAYNAGIDVHMITGSEARGLTLEEVFKLEEKEIKKIRQGGKAGNFGLIYRVSPAGFVDYARNTYGVIMTLHEATQFQARFFAKYPAVPLYHESQVEFAQQHGYVRSPLGRVRHLPLIKTSNSKLRGNSERQAINSPTQATLSDFGLLAMSEFDRQYPDTWFFGFVHDDIQTYFPEDDWEMWATRLKDTMENLPLEEYFGLKLPLTMQADVSMFSTNMAEDTEYKVWPPLAN